MNPSEPTTSPRSVDLPPAMAETLAALEVLRSQLNEAQAVARIGSWDWDVPNDRVTWTDELFRIFGLAPQTKCPNYEAYLRLVHPDDRARVDDAVQTALRTHTAFSIEYRTLTPDGRLRWLHGRGAVVTGPDGRPVRMHGTTQDITERKLADEVLRASEARYRMLAENSQDIITLSDANGIMKYVSPAGERLTGFTAEELIGKPGMEMLHPDDLPLLASSAGRDSQVILLRTRKKDGSYLWVETNIKRIVDPQTGSFEVLTSARDVTDRVAANETLSRMRQQLDEAQRMAQVGSWETNLETGQVSWSAENYRLYGLEPGAEVDLQAVFWDRIHPDDLPKMEALREHDLAIWENLDIEFRLLLPDGTIRHLQGRSHIGRDEQGRPLRLMGTSQDITERKRAEEALKASEAQYRLIADNSNDQISITSLDGRTLYASPATARLYGYDPAELVGTSPFQMVHPDDAPIAQKALQSLQRGEEVPNLTVRMLHKSGAYIWIESSIRLVHDEQTGEPEILAVTRDVTARKRTEAELLRTNTILKTQQEASIEGILLVDEHRRVVSYNHRYLELWGIPDDVVSSADDQALLNFVVSKLADPEAFLARVDDLYGQPMKSSRDEIVFADGRVLDRYSTPALSPQGHYYGRIWYFRDITDRKQAEREMQLIVEGTAAVTGQEFFNALVRHLAEVLGVRCAFVGRLLDDSRTIRTSAMWDDGQLTESIDYPIAGTPCSHTIREGEYYQPAGIQATFPEDLYLIEAGFEGYWGVRLTDPEGEVLGHVGVLHDAPIPRDPRSVQILRIFAARATAEMERQRAEEDLARNAIELQEANEHLKELDRHKVNYVNSVSHELRTPLTSIIGYTEFLEDTLREHGDEESLEFVGQVRQSTQRIQRLVDDLLDFALIEAGTFKLNRETTDFCRKAEEVVESLRPQLEKARLTLETDIAACPVMVHIDPYRIGQVLINFMTNAIKFSPRGGAIALKALVEGDRLVCEVHDCGPGIPAADQSKLFQRYSQLQPGARKGGAGLGLSISKALVEAHGGQIGVRSEEAQGSVFWFSLPLAGK